MRVTSLSFFLYVLLSSLERMSFCRIQQCFHSFRLRGVQVLLHRKMVRIVYGRKGLIGSLISHILLNTPMIPTRFTHFYIQYPKS